MEAGAAGGPEGRGPAPWHYAKHVSALLPEDADTRQTRRHIRFAQREVLWRESSLERVRTCGRVSINPDGNVFIRRNAGVDHYVGVATCGSIWSCPRCQATILNTRADEISTGTAGWDRAGHSVYMATLTAPHDMGMRLKPLLSTIADGFRYVIAGRAWIRLKKRLGIVGNIRSMEITYGKNGWHPHLHVLIFIEGDLDAAGLAELVLHLREKWQSFIVRAGYRIPSDQHGVDVQRCRSAAEAGQYIAKTDEGKSVGNEIARGDMKSGRDGNRTPLQILDGFRWDGDADDLRLWHEYERATKKRQRITWSKGLRLLLLGAEEEKSNEDVAAEEVGGEDLVLIPSETYRGITRRPGLQAAVLDASERGNLLAVNELLAKWGLAPVGPPPELVGRKAILKG